MPSTAKLAYKANAAQRARDYLRREGIGATVANLSGVLSVPWATLSAALKDRADKIGDMERRGRIWWPVEVEAPDPTFKHKGRGSGVIAGLRQPPDINAVWKGHSTPGPIRSGARDFEAVPSRMGDQRHAYQQAVAAVPHVEPEVKRGRPAKAAQCKHYTTPLSQISSVNPVNLPGVYPYSSNTPATA